jgi:hypothetical protein
MYVCMYVCVCMYIYIYICLCVSRNDIKSSNFGIGRLKMGVTEVHSAL